jgi:hypothetical protein
MDRLPQRARDMQNSGAAQLPARRRILKRDPLADGVLDLAAVEIGPITPRALERDARFLVVEQLRCFAHRYPLYIHIAIAYNARITCSSTGAMNFE